MIELLPCPFCGSTAKPPADPDEMWGTARTECTGDKNADCILVALDMTLERWNTRATIPAEKLNQRNLKTHPWNRYAP